MSAHFAVLLEADLIAAEKQGRTILEAARTATLAIFPARMALIAIRWFGMRASGRTAA